MRRAGEHRRRSVERHGGGASAARAQTTYATAAAHKDDPEKGAAVKAAFGENVIDVNNGDHADTVAKDIDEKLIERFITRTSA